MKYRRLGQSGLKVSCLALGSWLTYGRSVDKRATIQCIHTAIEHGINLIDTADVYALGDAERLLGEVLQDHHRPDLVIATKLFFPMSDDVNDRGLSRKHIMQSCEASLKRLKLETIDLYQCHRFDPEVPVFEVVRAMDDLIRQGKILYWGVSCWEAHQIYEACEIADRIHACPPISNQPPYNMLQPEIEREILPACAHRGLGQLVFSPLAQGLLTGKYLFGMVPDASRLANKEINRYIKRRMTPENLKKIEALGELAQSRGVSLPVLALAWCLRQENVSSAIMGASRAEQITDNVPAVDFEISPELMTQLSDILGASD